MRSRSTNHTVGTVFRAREATESHDARQWCAHHDVTGRLFVRASPLPLPAARHRCAWCVVRCGHVQTFFERMYMGKTSGLYGRAVDNFVRSLAGYAIVTYMLQVRPFARW